MVVRYRNLVSLESPDDPAWLCIVGQYKHCSQILFQCKDNYLILEKEEIGEIEYPVTVNIWTLQ